MKNVRLIMLLAACLLWPAGAFAQSDMLDWLAQFSGPGPFHGHFRSLNSRVLCTVGEGGSQRVDLWCGDDTSRNIKSVLAAEVAWPDSDSNPRFADDPQNTGRVRATRVVVNYFYRFHPMVDLGVGAGALTFSGDDFTNQVHFVLSPLTLQFTPLGWIHSSTNAAKWGRLIRLKFSERYVLGDIRAQDFNSLKSTYFKSGEWNANFGVGIDFWPFVDRRKNR